MTEPDKKKSAVERWIDDHREFMLIVFIIPIGVIFSFFSRIYSFFTRPNPSEHKKRIERVCRDVKSFARDHQGRYIRTNRKSPASLNVRVSDKSSDRQIRMHDLRAIVSLDTDSLTVRVEPFVKIGDLAAWLDRRGYQLATTIEMKNATVGGLVLAIGMTTSSHRQGLMADIVTAYEIVTATGDLVRAEKEGEHSDLFRAMPWSHGTLGLLTALELRIEKAPRYVRLVYRPFFNLSEFCSEYRRLLTSKEPPHYLEAQMFGRDRAVIIEGYKEFSPTDKKLKKNNILAWHKPYFFKHVETMLVREQGDSYEELVPNFSFHMRHDRSMCMTLGSILPSGNHPLFRWLWGWVLPPNMVLLKKSRPREERLRSMKEQVYQDIGFPEERLEELLVHLDNEFEIYPLLVYPCRIIDQGGMVRHPDYRNKPWDGKERTAFFCNLGIYGAPKAVRSGNRDYPTIEKVREVESFVRSWGGFLHTYVDVFCTRQEFEEMFDHSLWTEMRKKYGAEKAFPSIYEKIKPEIDPFSL